MADTYGEIVASTNASAASTEKKYEFDGMVGMVQRGVRKKSFSKSFTSPHNP